MITARSLRTATREELGAWLREGHSIEPAALEGYVYRGTSLGMPELFDRLAWKTFQKTFYRDPETRELRGWNVRLVQNGIDAESVAMTKGTTPLTFGHYRVVPNARRTPAPTAILLDYDTPANPRFDPTRRVIDPVVALNEGDASVLLGCTYLSLFGRSIATPSYFTLEREAPISFVP